MINHLGIRIALLLVLTIQWGHSQSLTKDNLMVRFYPQGGSYTNFVAVQLRCSEGMIRYTLDGSDPDSKSLVYHKPVPLSKDTIVKARAFPYNGNLPPSPIYTHEYSVQSTSFSHFLTELPVMVIFQPKDMGPMTNRVPIWMTLLSQKTNNGLEKVEVDFDGHASYWVRGGSSRANPKKSFRLETQDRHGHDKKTELLGLPKESDWVLYASYADRSFCRDVLAYEVWRQMGYYSPRWRFLEVFVVETEMAHVDDSSLHASIQSGNGNYNPYSALSKVTMSDYRGLYVLLEKIKRDDNRVKLEKLHYGDTDEPYVSGGYIFKKDRINKWEEGFFSSQEIHFAFEEPKEHELHPLQKQWLTNYINRFEGALFGEDFRDPTTGYRSYINTTSFIDYHWMVETFRNLDGYVLSVYLHKDRGRPLEMGPIWDWDMTLGNTIAQFAHKTEGWSWVQFDTPLYKWYERLFEDPDFLQEFIDRWFELRQGIFDTAHIQSQLESIQSQIIEARHRNHRRWGLNRRFHDNEMFFADHGRRSYEKAYQWIKKRLAWIDTQGFPAPKVQEYRHLAVGMNLVTLFGGGGKIFYTIDGSDPRATGGLPAEPSLQYTGAILLPAFTPIQARIASPYGLWSAPLRLSPAYGPQSLTLNGHKLK